MIANIGADVLPALRSHDPVAARSAFHAYRVIANGLGGGNEIVGGLWLFFVGLAMMEARQFPCLIAWTAMIIGGAGILTTSPPLAELTSLFGIGLILWYAWAGVALLQLGKAVVKD